MARQRSSRSHLVLPIFALALAATACDSGGGLDDTNDWATPIGGAGGTTAGGGTTGGAPGGSASGTAGGGIASGGIASGGIASGGIASGGIASGGIASGGTASAGGTASGGIAAGGGTTGGRTGGGTTGGGTTGGGTTGGGTTGGGTTGGGTTGGGTTGGGTTGGGTTGGGRTAGGGTTGGGSGLGGLFGGGGAAPDRTILDCCKAEDCSKCITDPPASMRGAQRGPHGGLLGTGFQRVELAGGTTYAPPADAKGPWPGFAIIPGFTNVGPEMEDWGPFFASWGIVTVITNSGPLDTPGLRGQWLLDAIGDLKEANTSGSAALKGKLSGQYGTGGYSMGGGGTTNASQSDKSLRSSIGLAPWTPVGSGISTPTIHFCGTIDIVADCSHAEWSYADIPAATPKALVTVSGCDHLTCWFGPADTTGGISGQLGLIWNKVYLEGDSRWKKLLTDSLRSSSAETNVK